MIRSLEVFAAKAGFYAFMALSSWLVLWGLFAFTLASLDSPVSLDPLAKVLSFIVVAYLVGLFAKTRKSSYYSTNFRSHSNRHEVVANLESTRDSVTPPNATVSLKTNFFSTLYVVVLFSSVVMSGFVGAYLYFGVAGLVSLSIIVVLVLAATVFRLMPDDSTTVVI